jgi:putative transposase
MDAGTWGCFPSARFRRMEWFRSRFEAAAIIETWRKHYNEVRPHSSLGYLTPHEFTKQHEDSETNQGGEAVL